MSGTANGTLGFLIKTEADGSIEWSKTYEEMNYTQVNSLIQTNDEVTFQQVAHHLLVTVIIGSFGWLKPTRQESRME